jgi:hypothetical protein
MASRHLVPTLLALTLAAVAGWTPANAAAGGRGSCGATDYVHAGLVSDTAQRGIAATIRVVSRPGLRSGHVAAWIGVGGEGVGANGANVWFQAGLSQEAGGALSLYYEVARPGADTEYVKIRDGVASDASYRLVVLESRYRPGWWAAFQDWTRITPWISLPGSHGAWRPVATAESWDGGSDVCNTFAFRFSDVLTASAPKVWSPIAGAPVWSPGTRVDRFPAGFLAVGRP